LANSWRIITGQFNIRNDVCILTRDTIVEELLLFSFLCVSTGGISNDLNAHEISVGAFNDGDILPETAE
jgi:hypothetical protein